MFSQPDHSRPAVQADTFETLMARALPPLPDGELDRLLQQVRTCVGRIEAIEAELARLAPPSDAAAGDQVDPHALARLRDDHRVAVAALEEAAEPIVRSHLRYIVDYLRERRDVGGRIMNAPGPARDEVMALACQGFWDATLHYDPVLAAERSGTGRSANLRTYAKVWMNKRVGEYRKREITGLPEEAALEWARVRRAVEALENRTDEDGRLVGRTPTDAEVAEYLLQEARAQLEAAGVEETPEALRARFALPEPRIAELRNRIQVVVSLDAPASEADGGGKVSETVPDPAATDSVPATGALANEVATRLDSERGQPLAERFGLPSVTRSGHYDRSSLDEIAFSALGVRAEAVGERLNNTLDLLRGEEVVRIDHVRPLGCRWTLGEIRAAAHSPAGAPPEMLAWIGEQVDLPALVRATGIPLNADGRGPCPSASAPAQGGDLPLTVAADHWGCSCCATGGDAVDWIEIRTGVSRADAVVRAARVAVAGPTHTGDTVRVVRDPARVERLTRGI